jgi:hypothetical protein
VEAAMGSLRVNNRAAIQALEEVLSEEQRSRVCEINRSDRLAPAGRRGAGPTADRRGSEGMMGAMGGRYVWPWCVAATPAEGAPAAEGS